MDKVISIWLTGLITGIFWTLALTGLNEAHADDVVVSVYTYHHNDDVPYRDDTLGLFYRAGDDQLKGVFGIYQNSDWRTSAMVGVAYDMKANDWITFAPALGLVTGYEWKVMPIVTPTVVFFNRLAVTPLVTWSSDPNVKTDWAINFGINVMSF